MKTLEKGEKNNICIVIKANDVPLLLLQYYLHNRSKSCLCNEWVCGERDNRVITCDFFFFAWKVSANLFSPCSMFMVALFTCLPRRLAKKAIIQ